MNTSLRINPWIVVWLCHAFYRHVGTPIRILGLHLSYPLAFFYRVDECRDELRNDDFVCGDLRHIRLFNRATYSQPRCFPHGLEDYGLAMGLISGGHALGGAVGALFGGDLFDLFARYTELWWFAFGAAILTGAMVFMLTENRRTGVSRFAAAQYAPRRSLIHAIGGPCDRVQKWTRKCDAAHYSFLEIVRLRSAVFQSWLESWPLPRELVASLENS